MNQQATEPRTYPEGVTSWVDTEQDDVDAAADFYSGVFGWTFSEATPPGVPFRYLIAQLDGRDVGGLGGPATPAGQSGDAGRESAARWHTYVAVDDADATARRVEQAGGAVVQPPTAAGEGGRSVVVRDPQGLEVRLWEAKRRLGSQVTNVPGAWNFSDLHTDEPAAAQQFYARAFGWVFADVGFATMIRVPGYGDHLASTVDPDIHERQSGAKVPPGFADAIGWVVPVAPRAEPGWHVTFTVAERDAAADRVVRLGGSLVRTGDSDWTRTAVVRDPQGAEFTVSQFLG
ncbi:VOC family protein [Terrabacter sp. Root181]|uniref:VOC family protein n=1 Tax=Terrabacter sp. Root181 TaxID=1736484 RepID=UPI0007012C81|nr:VOC family protein [Terrabacter sp. Root181]KRB43667.1 glyoxalase [Terrabacter sp. Root181]